MVISCLVKPEHSLYYAQANGPLSCVLPVPLCPPNPTAALTVHSKFRVRVFCGKPFYRSLCSEMTKAAPITAAQH